MPPFRCSLRLALRALPVLALLAGAAGAAHAQRTAAGAVTGTIVDAQTGHPLPGAAVTLEPVPAGALPPARTARTDSVGRYRFAAVAEGSWRLRVERVGYRPAQVEVVLRGAAESRVSLGLEVQPVTLEPMAAVGEAPRPPANPFGRRGADEGDAGARVEAELARQREHLAPDVRVVTAADVEEGVTLAEVDLFRAMQRLPGVGARDEYSAELRVRGAPWDHTRVYWDGLPVYHPVHPFGIFSGIGADAVGAAALHPGAQPLATGGGAAAALEVRSRRAAAPRGVAGSVEATLLSARATLELGGEGSRHALLVSGRSSHSPELARRIERRARSRDVWATSHFADVAGRYDLALGEGRGVEASVLWQRDEVADGPDAAWLGGTRPRWGSLAARVSGYRPVAGHRVQATVGVSRLDASVREGSDTRAAHGPLFSWPTLFGSRSELRFATAELRVEPAAAPGTPAAWAAGGGVTGHRARYRGPPPYPLSPALPPAGISRSDELSYAFAWAEGRRALAPSLTVEGGVRVEAGGALEGSGGLRWSPRGAVRFRAGPSLLLSAAAGRSSHAVQAGPDPGDNAITQHLWLVAGDDAPLVRSDVLTMGAEWWMGGGWLASASAFERRTKGMAVLDPRPGEVIGRDVFVRGELRAEGVEVGMRRLAGWWTASAAYTWGRAEQRAAGLAFAAEADQRHALDLAARARVGWGVGVGAAFSAASGGAFSPFFGGVALCRPDPQLPCEWTEAPRAGTPGTLRAPWYAAADVTVDWTRRLGRWGVGTFVQVHNATGRDNPARYNRSISYDDCGAGAPCVEHVWSRGLPRLVLAGARVSF